MNLAAATTGRLAGEGKGIESLVPMSMAYLMVQASGAIF